MLTIHTIAHSSMIIVAPSRVLVAVNWQESLILLGASSPFLCRTMLYWSVGGCSSSSLLITAGSSLTAQVLQLHANPHSNSSGTPWVSSEGASFLPSSTWMGCSYPSIWALTLTFESNRATVLSLNIKYNLKSAQGLLPASFLLDLLASCLYLLLSCLSSLLKATTFCRIYLLSLSTTPSASLSSLCLSLSLRTYY